MQRSHVSISQSKMCYYLNCGYGLGATNYKLRYRRYSLCDSSTLMQQQHYRITPIGMNESIVLQNERLEVLLKVI